MQVTGLDQVRARLNRWVADTIEHAEQTVEVGFTAAYAIFVHENLEARHEPPWGKGGQAKFIEQPIRERQQELADVITAAVKAGRTPLQAQLLAGLTLQGWAQALTPIDTGNLRASAYTKVVDRNVVMDGGLNP